MSETTSTAPTSRARLAAAWAAATAWMGWRAWPTLDTTVDDAFISARYAQQLAEGSGLVYNAGEPPVEGITNLAWTLLLAVVHLIGVDVRTAMLGMGLVFGAATLAMVMGLASAIAGKVGPGTLVAPFILAAHPAFAISSTNGLETTMFAFAVVAACWAALACPERWRLAAGLGIGAVGLVRPEGLAVSFGLIAYDGLRRAMQGHKKRRFAFVAGLVAMQLPILLWRLWTYGQWLPNTFAAKGGDGWFSQLDANFHYIDRYGQLWPAATALALLALVASRRHLARSGLVLALSLGLVLVALQVNLWMPGGRLFVPPLALVCALAAAPLSHLVLAPRVIWCIVLLAFTGMSLDRTLVGKLRRQDEIYSVSRGSGIEVAGRHMAEHAPSGSWLATRDAGVLAYYAGSAIHVAELHPRALTQLHPDGKASRFQDFMPNDPAFMVFTVRKWKGKPPQSYGADGRVWRSFTAEYAYLGRVKMHHHRYYDVYARADLDIPPLPKRAVVSYAGHQKGTVIRHAE
ncbi:MAG: hypothetical protein KC912_16225 [Proteobacteria bacterium]|nr:hypothetical protein [Pseudomonadota bacterium]